ncbi:MAG: PIG-L family deacetylase [Akkermansiaceae bacterium]|nr:PIG-L family deacetylase [Verrucomicrobiae bacterium]MCP5553859.1 PIG-L family deacetylase [Akkermansiaceae bacterium]
MPTAIAIAAHPDDIEFVMAGTLLRLREAGWEIHYLNLSSGNAGSTQLSPQDTRITRARESRDAAKILGAVYHGPIGDDLEILYTVPLLRKLSAVIRSVAPEVVLTHSPQDYMEDHMNTSRLAVTAAFARGMPNFLVDPPTAPVANPVTVYHALPHGLRDGLRRRVRAGAYVDTTSVHDQKRAALAAHRSQKEWLDTSQGMDSYLVAMDELSSEVARMSGGKVAYAEGWRRHSHLGFSAKEIDPLKDALGRHYWIDEAYEQGLED